jgi:hypothetical protein
MADVTREALREVKRELEAAIGIEPMDKGFAV